MQNDFDGNKPPADNLEAGFFAAALSLGFYLIIPILILYIFFGH